MSPALLLSLAPVLVILAFRTLCTSKPAPIPTYGVIGRMVFRCGAWFHTIPAEEKPRKGCGVCF